MACHFFVKFSSRSRRATAHSRFGSATMCEPDRRYTPVISAMNHSTCCIPVTAFRTYSRNGTQRALRNCVLASRSAAIETPDNVAWALIRTLINPPAVRLRHWTEHAKLPFRTTISQRPAVQPPAVSFFATRGRSRLHTRHDHACSAPNTHPSQPHHTTRPSRAPQVDAHNPVFAD